jgi:DNA-binding transcriptional LysR family regulator
MMAGMGFPVERMRFPYRSANFVVAWEMVRAGHAICVLDDRIGDGEPEVERILPDLPPVTFPVWLVAHRDVRRARRLRAVWDALAAGLA